MIPVTPHQDRQMKTSQSDRNPQTNHTNKWIEGSKTNYSFPKSKTYPSPKTPPPTPTPTPTTSTPAHLGFYNKVYLSLNL